MAAALRIALIGCGQMGQIHLKTLAQLTKAKIVAIVEPDKTRRETIAADFGCTGYADIRDIRESLDAVTIASPSSTHHSLAQYFLAQGLPCLVEKPMASNPDEIKDFIHYANKVPILVGHSERYNPAFIALQQALQDIPIQAIAARRLNWGSTRIIDTDVTMDLMVHDLDLAFSLLRCPITKVQSQFMQKDHCEALLTFADEILVNLTASRMSPCRLRELTVTTATAFYSADLLNQCLYVYTNGGSTPEKLPVTPIKPLIAQYQHFFEVIEGKAPPLVDAATAAQTLEVIWQLQRMNPHA